MPFIIPPSALPSVAQQEEIKLKPLVETRLRYERRTDQDFNEGLNDNFSFLDYRVRAGFQGTAGKNRFVVRWMYGGEEYEDVSGRESSDRTVLYEAYGDVPMGEGRFKFGRQEMQVGSRRYVASSSWGNEGRTYDAVRFTVPGESAATPKADIFFSQIGQASSYSKDARIGGAGFNSGLGQTYLLYKHDNVSAGVLDLLTLNHRYERDLGENLGLVLDGAFQWGDAGSRRKEAWALHTQLSYESGPVTVYGEYNTASGGGSSTLDRSFDVLYPSTHGVWGHLDMQGNRNYEHITLGADYAINDDLEMYVGVHNFWLRDPRDGWYKASGSLNTFQGGSFIDPTGSSGRFVGTEFDLVFTYTPNDHDTFGFGGALMKPGSFIKAFTGPDTRDQVWFYGFYSRKF